MLNNLKKNYVYVIIIFFILVNTTAFLFSTGYIFGQSASQIIILWPNPDINPSTLQLRTFEYITIAPYIPNTPTIFPGSLSMSITPPVATTISPFANNTPTITPPAPKISTPLSITKSITQPVSNITITSSPIPKISPTMTIVPSITSSPKEICAIYELKPPGSKCICPQPELTAIACPVTLEQSFYCDKVQKLDSIPVKIGSQYYCTDIHFDQANPPPLPSGCSFACLSG